MKDVYQYSTTEIIRILGQRTRAYRIRLGLTQKELAERAGVSVPTLQAFEAGQSKDISFSTMLRLLRGLGQLDGANTLLAEIAESPYDLRGSQEQVKRVRHSKREEKRGKSMSEVMKYKKLQVYNKAIELVVHVYALIKKFPREEQFALGDQLRRALISVPSNIAEGMGRVSTRDRAHFVEIAYGSLMEVNCQLEIAMKLGYISIEELSAENKECEEIARMLSGLRASLLSTLDS